VDRVVDRVVFHGLDDEAAHVCDLKVTLGLELAVRLCDIAMGFEPLRASGAVIVLELPTVSEARRDALCSILLCCHVFAHAVL
jgi:hypothetical protein